MKKHILLVILTLSTPVITNSLFAESDDYCAQCCAQGRYVDAECGRRCQGCIIRGKDETAQELRDYPA